MYEYPKKRFNKNNIFFVRYSYNYGGKGRFQHIGDSLFVQMITISPSSDLKKVGLYNPKDERFGVVLLNRNKMILRSKDALLEFRKF